MTFNFHLFSTQQSPGDGRGPLARFEQMVLRRPTLVRRVQWGMVAIYLALIVIPVMLPASQGDALPLSDFVSLSRFLIWGLWWPFVVLSLVVFGRIWCGLLCPEGTIVRWLAPKGGNRPVPKWMRFGGVPLLSFLGITIVGQLLEVDEDARGQLIVLGGSSLAAAATAWIYSQRLWSWCRYLCPVSLLFGVFSRLGSLHFAVDRQRLRARCAVDASETKGPCPVGIHLPVLTTNRSCLMCFRCAGHHDAIHLGFRAPGEELNRIDSAEPLLSEVIFLFGGAIGLPIGVFLGERLELYGVKLVALLLASTFAAVAALGIVTLLAAWLLDAPRTTDSFVQLGYVYTPISLFSLFLGLSHPTFEVLSRLGASDTTGATVRMVLFFVGAAWSMRLTKHVVARQRTTPGRALASRITLVSGISVIATAWARVLF
ncbi:MAG: 4Fe-4S binding protein [Anaeromyxobacter sp.]